MASSGDKASSLASRALRYLRRDIREIVWPRAMADPPRRANRRRMTAEEHKEAWGEAVELYKESWRNVFRRADAGSEEAKATTLSSTSRGEETKDDDETEEDEQTIARGNAEGRLLAEEAKKTISTARSGLKPFVTYLYETRGRAYRDGIKEFVKAYRQGLHETQEEYEKDERESLSMKASSMLSKMEDMLERAEKSEPVQLPDDSDIVKDRKL